MASRLLDGKVAVITGAASGMGLATAETFVANGARVVLSDVQEDAGVAAAERLGERARFQKTDVTDDAQIDALVRYAVDEFGALDVMYSNAGAAGDLSPIIDISREGLDRTLALNLTAHASAHKHATRQFQRQGTAGSIITTASIAALQAGWNGAAYSIAKAGVMALVRQTALENKGTGTRSNAILPGGVMTPMIPQMFGIAEADAQRFLDRAGEAIAGETLIGRTGYASDIANVALFLASDLSSWVTGIGITVDGGAMAFTKDATVELITQVAGEFS
ncbi:SDR family oxidoreductase [Gordonia sp. TBRC 11910]|uniref:SDR family oxidoreductase n=1 Tax=Gordonia asplenii TaxID=2725283 RepID=A0A848KWT9_9ACTN|nr:SDR family oxidoreductase [Gordonia asplenii]NMO03080.1 SDR family oxidoreductase [Gordonia asplenii]